MTQQVAWELMLFGHGIACAFVAVLGMKVGMTA
ncbi:hypothetical protein FHY02_000400 [Sphingomonas sp. BK069]|nr:hypothetical protein [Sphingomonas sp. BK069]